MARKPTYEELEQRIRVLEEESAKGKQLAEECKRTEEALRESESRYRTVFEGAQDGIAVADAGSGRKRFTFSKRVDPL